MINFYEFKDKIPEHTKQAISNYIEYGLKPGSFLQYVIANDVHSAVRVADSENFAALGDILLFFINYTEQRCRGSFQALDYWIERKSQNEHSY